MCSMERNPFLAYIKNHPDADQAALKELFRILAKRTHPDLGAEDTTRFVALQEHYHEALTRLIDVEHTDAPPTPRAEPRERVLGALYRYKAHLPRIGLDSRDLPPACAAAFDAALASARGYTRQAEAALEAFDEQFHRERAANARYPDVRVKYESLIRALSGFFDYQSMPNSFNERVTRSYLDEIRPVTDVDPTASLQMRHNRSAAARSALYRMRTWIEAELELPTTRII